MICLICEQQVAHLEEHHIIPREYGGERLETINICSTCHHGLHHQANSYWSAQQNNKPITMYFTFAVWERAKPYVQAILQARSDYQVLGKPAVRPRRLVINIPNELLQGLHRLKKYHGYSSLNRFIRDHLEQLVKTSL